MTKNRLDLLKFKTIDAKNIGTIDEYIKKYKFETCDYNTSNFFAWSHFLNVKWDFYKDRILFYNFSSQFMLFPLGKTMSTRELKEISLMAENEGFRGNFISVPEEYVKSNPGLNDHFELIYDDCNSDYIYLTEKLVELKGKKLRKKKNLISQFKRICPDYSVEKLSEEYIETCIELAKRWYRDQIKIKDEDKQLELDVMRRALYNQDKIGLEGILIFDGELLIAFTLFSEQRPDMATVHFEKFDYSYKGAAQIVNRETAINLRERYKYLNREQDMCKIGLRRSKLSYDPVKIAVTYKLLSKSRKTT